MHSILSRLATGVSFIALIATMPGASAGIITALNVAPSFNTPGNATQGFIAVGPTSAGTMTVDGGSILTMTPNAVSEGQINVGGAQIGNSGTAGSGVVTVRGAGSQINFNGASSIFLVGRWGTASQATLNILDGGSVNMSAGFGLRVGRGNTNAGFGTDGARGEVLVDGIGSRLSITGIDLDGFATGMQLGRDGGSGALTVSNGGVVHLDSTASSSSAFLTLGGRGPGSDPTSTSSSGRGDIAIRGVGSKLSMSGDGAGIDIGRFGSTSTANLEVSAGGRLESQYFNVGRGENNANGATGTAIVDGAGSVIALSGRGRTGEAPGGAIGDDQGRGTLVLRNGARFTIDASQATQTGGGFTIGRDGGTGTLALETGGSLKIFGNALGGMGLTAGRNGGTGTVTVGNGAAIRIETPSGATTAGSGITLGRDSGSTGTMRVDGGTVALDIDHHRNSISRSAIVVGRDSSGTLDIVNGGVMTLDGQAPLTVVVTAGGNYSSDPVNRVSGNGLINVAGNGSKLDVRGNDGTIEIGRWGSASRGEMVVSGGATVAANTLRIGIGQAGSDGATGRVAITGVGSAIALAGTDIDRDGGQIWIGRDGGDRCKSCVARSKHRDHSWFQTPNSEPGTPSISSHDASRSIQRSSVVL